MSSDRSPELQGTPSPVPPEGASPGAIPLTRDMVARFVMGHEARIRQVARTKLTSETRGVFDSEDVMSSVLRRMDTLAANGSLRPHNEAELWGLIEMIAANTAVSKTRLMERARMLSKDDTFAQAFLQRLGTCEVDDEARLLVLRMAGSLNGDRYRQMFFLRMRGATHHAIAGLLGMTDCACRQMWSAICQQLRSGFDEGRFDG